MANVSRYEPFGDVFDDLLKGFFVRPMTYEGQPAAPGRIKIDVSEKDGAYVVHAEIPGVKKEDIQVSIDGNQVSISAEVKKQTEEKQGERTLRSERYYGKVFRSFTLAQDVNEAEAQAKYNEGVLELTLPKKAVSAAKKLAIQ